jgi:2-methylcitrate dehydratase PrpD
MGHVNSTVATLARWSASVRLEDIPDAVRAVAGRCVIDTLGVALAGSVSAVARQARAVIAVTAAPGQSTVLGSTLPLCAPAAAFANATAGHALDFDDNCNAGFVHGSVVVLPAALAVAQMFNLSGARLLTAFVVGAECEYALAQTLTRDIYDRGWWTTGILGSLGACAAACHAMGLDAQKTACALGLVLAGGGGVKAAFGTDAKTLMAGRASESGVIAALLARAGSTGPLDVVEHPRGIAAMFCAREVTAPQRLGQDWNLLSPGVDIKQIPVCLSSHAAVDAFQEILSRSALKTDDIAEIVCDVPNLVIHNLIHDLPATPQQAQFSMPFTLACIGITGVLTLDSLSDATLENVAIARLMSRVRMHTSARWTASLLDRAPEGAWVRVITFDGRVFEHFCGRHKGSSDAPLSCSQLHEKFIQCASRALPHHEVQSLLHNLEHLTNVPDTRALFTPVPQAENRPS